MNGDLHRRASEIFLAVCDLPPQQRRAALDQQCGRDEALRAAVESLLRHDLPESQRDSSPSTTATVRREKHENPVAPTTVGPYRILSEIGRGGMGVVYLGLREGDQFRRRVAIKVLKRGIDTEQVLHRFELERQVLAALNHPGIARLYDADETEDGTPYFAMEYVEGEAIEHHCDTHRLRIPERLGLFRKVCAAVHYAHQNLIVHRDLKPSNILVTRDGEVKLLDFGIAKLINPEFSLVVGEPTAPELRVMTPEYASPEQVRGDVITTASDIYALGVLLYELVSGHRPYRFGSRVQAELERVICEEDPEKPSTAISRVEEAEGDREKGDTTTRTITPESVCRERESRPDRLRRELVGDIDNIVLMAMRKEPQRRYVSAEQLAEDIRRHGDGRPVIAHRDTAGYRLVKFLGRNRTGVAVAAVIALLLVGGILATTTAWRSEAEQRRLADRLREEAVQAQGAEQVQRELAEIQRDLARSRFGQVRSLATTFMYEFHDAIVTLDGSVPARELLVTEALEYLDALSREVEDDPGLARELAAAYDRVGDILGGVRNPSLGDVDTALDKYRTAFEIRQKLARAAPDDVELQLELSRSHLNFGDMLFAQGDMAGALAAFREMLGICESVVRTRSSDANARRLLSIALQSVGDVLGRTGDSSAAVEHFTRSLELRRELTAERPDDLVAQRDLSTSLLRLGHSLAGAGRYEESIEVYGELIRIRERPVTADPESGRARRDLANAQYFLAASHLDLEQPQEALRHLGPSLAVAEQRAKDNPRSARARFDLATRHDLVGQAHSMLGDRERAKQHFREFHEMIAGLTEARPERADYRTQFAVSYERLAEDHAQTGDRAEAIREVSEAIAIFEELLRSDPTDALVRQDLARTLLTLGRWLAEDGKRIEALQRFEAGHELYAALLQSEPENVAVRDGLVEALGVLLALSLDLEDGAAAVAFGEEAITVTDDPSPALLRDLAAAYFLAGDRERAIEKADQALERLGDGLEAVELRKLIEDDLVRYRER